MAFGYRYDLIVDALAAYFLFTMPPFRRKSCRRTTGKLVPGRLARPASAACRPESRGPPLRLIPVSKPDCLTSCFSARKIDRAGRRLALASEYEAEHVWRTFLTLLRSGIGCSSAPSTLFLWSRQIQTLSPAKNRRKAVPRTGQHAEESRHMERWSPCRSVWAIRPPRNFGQTE